MRAGIDRASEQSNQAKSKTMIAGKSLLLSCALLFSACASENSSGGLGAYPKAVAAADEASAIQTLRTIATAEEQMKSTRGLYGDFNSLVGAGFLDQRFAGEAPVLKGFRFTISATGSEFAAKADPQTTGAQATTGSRHFYLDSSDNVLHFNLEHTASKNDPVL
jgi:hypothetical protein